LPFCFVGFGCWVFFPLDAIARAEGGAARRGARGFALGGAIARGAACSSACAIGFSDVGTSLCATAARGTQNAPPARTRAHLRAAVFLLLRAKVTVIYAPAP
jgi:dienelactone hydrolase